MAIFKLNTTTSSNNKNSSSNISYISSVEHIDEGIINVITITNFVSSSSSLLGLFLSIGWDQYKYYNDWNDTNNTITTSSSKIAVSTQQGIIISTTTIIIFLILSLRIYINLQVFRIR